jgi:hypothetical protein
MIASFFVLPAAELSINHSRNHSDLLYGDLADDLRAVLVINIGVIAIFLIVAVKFAYHLKSLRIFKS